MEVIVLAAGQGKRMRSVLPKVLQPLAAKPMLAHVLDTARILEARRIVVVYGHGGELMPPTWPGPGRTRPRAPVMQCSKPCPWWTTATPP
jgi:bifunctional UDP-N-acetylglucosamine pyrophosphorylase/glucosamine-1-phosphate N-acetyltransferase